MALKQDPQTIRHKPVKKVGVLVVHGIGEQRRFEHLEAETRKIVDAIIRNYGQQRRDITVTLQTGASDAFLGDQSNWVSEERPPLHALVELPAEIVDIAFHEVWWADVNETLTLGKQFRFWLWGFSLAGIATHNDLFLPGAMTSPHIRLPVHAGQVTWWHRIRISYVAALFFISTFSIALLNLILKRLNGSPLLTTGVIVNLLSGVKLYSQTKRAGGSPMEGPDEPPRAAIRRRMVRGLIDVATAGYERWYVLAHSLGSIVAFNGLMETEEALPNYLDYARWQTVQAAPGLAAASPSIINVNAMMPNRPLWLGRREMISRATLFSSFRGLLTYGSPLERFGALWGAMVPINDQPVFAAGTEWINVYDPTDPVGTWIADFDPIPPGEPGVLTPQNFPCRASPVLLLSHICYLTASRLRALRAVNDSPNLLVNQVAHWLVTGGSLVTRLDAAPKGEGTFWMPRELTPAGTVAGPGLAAKLRGLWRYLQWLIAGLILTGLALISLNKVIIPLIQGGVQWLRSLIS